MRCFIGLNIETMKPFIDEFVDRMNKFMKLNNIKLVFRVKSSYHITLRFLGEISNKKAKQIIANLEKNKVKFQEISLNLVPSHISSFGKNIPEIIWLGFNKKTNNNNNNNNNQNNLYYLKELVDSILSEQITNDNVLDFIPHLTLSRIRRKKNYLNEKQWSNMQEFSEKIIPEIEQKHKGIFNKGFQLCFYESIMQRTTKFNNKKTIHKIIYSINIR